MSLLTEHIPEGDRAASRRIAIKLELGEALLDLGGLAAGLRNAGEVAFYVGQEHGHTEGAEVLREDLQRNRLARAGCAGDEAVAVGHLWQQHNVRLALGEKDG